MLAEILNNSQYYHFENDFCHNNTLSQMSVIFQIYFQQLHVLFCLLRFISLLSKSVFVTRFASANLAAKLFAVSLLYSGVVIHLS